MFDQMNMTLERMKSELEKQPWDSLYRA
jgi:hypothetical protein